VSAPMGAAEFERRYRSEGDPWGYLDSSYEHAKYRATLCACGEGPFSAALELGGSIGVFTEMLAPRCLRLTTIDFAPTAVAAARARLAEQRHVSVCLGTIPQAIPSGPFDLVVASEILYYLTDAQLQGTFGALERELACGGRLVAVHWIPAGPERPRDAHAAHESLLAQRWLKHERSLASESYLLDAFLRR
jgi:cyclopropane fatty-acyl-phospholipid synthase-like methyltransferase